MTLTESQKIMRKLKLTIFELRPLRFEAVRIRKENAADIMSLGDFVIGEDNIGDWYVFEDSGGQIYLNDDFKKKFKRAMK